MNSNEQEAKTKLLIEDLNLYYGDFHALHGINMDIKEKEITAFIGPSGCGKSTLLKSLNRMNDLVEGCRIDAPTRGHGVSKAQSLPDECI